MKLGQLIDKYQKIIFCYLPLNLNQLRVFHAIRQCRTPDLGGHLYYCEDCGSTMILYNSCRNRNCPTCQGNKRRQWVEKQLKSLINVPYYHVVFTIPDVLNSLFLTHQKECYEVLYRSVWETLKGFFGNVKYLGGQGGMMCILHTWGQTLVYHPHLHCIVPGCGITENGEFRLIKGKYKYLFNVESLAKVFRAKFAQELTLLEQKRILVIPPITRKLMFCKNWVVFCKKPFATPQIVVNNLGMYTHRIAISESRIVEDNEQQIGFWYKNYRKKGAKEMMYLNTDEFFRRFAYHILPKRFVKIRSFGLLNNRNKKQFIEMAGNIVGRYQVAEPTKEQTQRDKIIEKAKDQIELDKIEQEIEQEYETENFTCYRKKTTLILCPVCRKSVLTELCSISAEELETDLFVVHKETKRLIYQSRDGPIPDNFETENDEFEIKWVSY